MNRVDIAEKRLYLLQFKIDMGWQGTQICDDKLYLSQGEAEDVGVDKAEKDDRVLDYYVTSVRCSKELIEQLQKEIDDNAK